MSKAPKIPSTSNYLKLQQGENTFRVLGDVITGYEYFNNKGKPVRSVNEPEGIPEDIGEKEGKLNPIKYFWAMVVWNYKEERIQIAEFTQKKTILNPLEAYWNKSNWGELTQYDITITKKGSTINDTEYAVMANPKEKLDKKIEDAYKAKPINLDALYTGDDPFSSKAPAVPKGTIKTPSGIEYPEDAPNPDDVPF